MADNGSSDLTDFTGTGNVKEQEYAAPSAATLFKVIWFSIRGFFVERQGRIICSAFLALMLWGYHGRMELLSFVLPGWRGPGVDIGSRPQLIPGIPWDNELISFWGGALLCVVFPMLLIKFVFRQPLSDFGLGLPPKNRRKLAVWAFVLLFSISLVPFWLGTSDPAMVREYPLFKPFPSGSSFVLYELTYLPFFIAIEFIFRGYLLFGLANAPNVGAPGNGSGVDSGVRFGRYALVISMLPYIAWHLGKPVPELWGTIVWGFAAGAAAYSIRSIWPVVAAHWLLNVFMDAVIAKPF